MLLRGALLAALLLVASTSSADAFNAFNAAATGKGNAAGRRAAAGSSQLRMARGDGFLYYKDNPFWTEESYKTFVKDVKANPLVIEVYPIVDRVREKKLLTRTAESGLLSALQEQGITLSQAEKLLPLLEQTGALSFLAKNGEFLLNTVGFLAVEPAELALPVLAGAIKAGPSAFTNAAAALAALELGVVVVTGNPVLDVVAGIPLLGGAFLLNTVGGVLSDIKAGSFVAPVVSARSSAPASSSPVSIPKLGGSRPSAAKVVVTAAPKKIVAAAPVRVVAPKKALGNLGNLPKAKLTKVAAAPAAPKPKASPAAPKPKPAPAAPKAKPAPAASKAKPAPAAPKAKPAPATPNAKAAAPAPKAEAAPVSGKKSLGNLSNLPKKQSA